MAAMAAVRVQLASVLMSESMVSLLDLQSALNHSMASLSFLPIGERSATSSAGQELKTDLRRSSKHEANGTCPTSKLIQISKFIDENHTALPDGERPRYAFNEAEMRRVFERFDHNADGLICGEDLQRYMRCCGKEMSDTEVDCMISSADSNCDGTIDFPEFFSLFESNSAAEDKEENENEVDEEEHLLLEAFRVFDRNGDGFISAQELQTVLLNLGMPEGKCLNSCEKMIRVVDRNGDGKCDIREFQEMMSSRCFQGVEIQ